MRRLVLFLTYASAFAGASAFVGASAARAGGPGDVAPALDLARVIALAAEASPAVRLVRAQVAEAEGRLETADVRTVENPTVSAAMGPRIGPKNGVDVDLSLEVPIEIGGRRSKRVSAASEEVTGERLRVEDASREAVAVAVRAYFRALRSEERLGLARQQKNLAEEVLAAARARHEAGQVPRLEVNLAEAEVARAQSQIAAEQVGTSRTRSELALALGLPSATSLRPSGKLADRALLDGAASNVGADHRPDVLASLSDVRAADAEVSLAEAQRLPDLAFTAGYAREEDANIVTAGVSVSLPLFNPRTGAVAEARARRNRARIEAEIKKAAASAQIEGARAAYAAAVEALRAIEDDVLPSVLENEKLTYESYRAGKIGLATLLQVRREALETRRAYLDSLLGASEAATDVAAAQGSFPTSPNRNP